MMDVWEMNVFMNHDFVPVWVGMRLDAIPRKIVYVPVVHVMSMSVGVVDCIVCVLMFVSFAQMQPKTDRHKYAGDAQLHRDSVAERKVLPGIRRRMGQSQNRRRSSLFP